MPVTTYSTIVTRYGTAFLEYPDHGHWLIAEPGWDAIARDVAT